MISQNKWMANNQVNQFQCNVIWEYGNMGISKIINKWVRNKQVELDVSKVLRCWNMTRTKSNYKLIIGLFKSYKYQMGKFQKKKKTEVRYFDDWWLVMAKKTKILRWFTKWTEIRLNLTSKSFCNNMLII